MNIEDSNFIVEISDFDEVNQYLELGWILINQYKIDVGGYEQPNQKPMYVLAWQKNKSELKHPENSSYIRQKREAENFNKRRKNWVTPTID